MAKINFLGPINMPSIDIKIDDFNMLKNELNKIEKLKQWIPICAISINDNIITSTDNITIKDDDVISLLPPVCGG